MFDWYEHKLIIFLVWLVLVVLKKWRTGKGDFDVFLFILGLTSYVVFARLAVVEIEEIYVDILIYGGSLYTVFMFDIRALSRKDHTREKLKELNKTHEDLKDRSELLRQRFITMLDLLDDGIVFRTDENKMFGTETFLKLSGLSEHEFTLEDFLERLHPDDRAAYLAVLDKCSRRNPKYRTHYRIKRGAVYEWVKETGTLVVHDGRKMFIAIVRGLDVRRYPRTEVDLLNQIHIGDALEEALQRYNRRKEPYALVFFELSNIKTINDQYGRDIGDLMMGKFLNKLVYHFLKDTEAIFRLSGIRFAMVITDHRKFEMLRRALEEGGELVNFTMTFGEVKESVYPYFGIQNIDYFDEPVTETISRGHKALRIALEDRTPENYFIIK